MLPTGIVLEALLGADGRARIGGTALAHASWGAVGIAADLGAGAGRGHPGVATGIVRICISLAFPESGIAGNAFFCVNGTSRRTCWRAF